MKLIKTTLNRLFVAVYLFWLAFGCFGFPLFMLPKENIKVWMLVAVVCYYLPFIYIDKLSRFADKTIYGKCK